MKKIFTIAKLRTNIMKNVKKEQSNLLDYKKISNIEFSSIYHNDAPDYCDAYIVSAEYDGEEMTETQIEELNDDRDFVYEKLMDYLY